MRSTLWHIRWRSWFDLGRWGTCPSIKLHLDVLISWKSEKDCKDSRTPSNLFRLKPSLLRVLPSLFWLLWLLPDRNDSDLHMLIFSLFFFFLNKASPSLRLHTGNIGKDITPKNSLTFPNISVLSLAYLSHQYDILPPHWFFEVQFSQQILSLVFRRSFFVWFRITFATVRKKEKYTGGKKKKKKRKYWPSVSEVVEVNENEPVLVSLSSMLSSMAMAASFTFGRSDFDNCSAIDDVINFRSRPLLSKST